MPLQRMRSINEVAHTKNVGSSRLQRAFQFETRSTIEATTRHSNLWSWQQTLGNSLPVVWPPRLIGNPFRRRNMSAFGTKRTSACALHMSAFDPKRTFGPFRPLPTNVPLSIPGGLLEPYDHWLRLHCEVEYAVQPAPIRPGPCPHCDGELECFGGGDDSMEIYPSIYLSWHWCGALRWSN